MIDKRRVASLIGNWVDVELPNIHSNYHLNGEVVLRSETTQKLRVPITGYPIQTGHISIVSCFWNIHTHENVFAIARSLSEQPFVSPPHVHSLLMTDHIVHLKQKCTYFYLHPRTRMIMVDILFEEEKLKSYRLEQYTLFDFSSPRYFDYADSIPSSQQTLIVPKIYHC